MLMNQLKKGDYVVATKYKDGDIMDHWCVGFFDGLTSSKYTTPRFNVVDNKGNQFRGNGFRRVEIIASDEGEFLLKQPYTRIDIGLSIWDLLYMYRRHGGFYSGTDRELYGNGNKSAE